MEKRCLSPVNKELSLLGFGCMRLPRVCEEKQDIDEERAAKMIDDAIKRGVNYFDTAYTYHDGMSETFIGKTLVHYDRESYHLASKMPMWAIKTEEDVERIFNEQLAKCQVEYFDFYLLHNLNVEHYKVAKELHVYEFLSRMKEEGKIRHLGFSFHDKPLVLEEIARNYHWDFAQIQLNYLDWELQDAKRQYEILTENQIPVVVMEPVRGGALASLSEAAAAVLKEENKAVSIASWAIRYVASLPNVMVILSGMSTEEQVEDNLYTVENFKPLTEREREILDKALQIYRESSTVACTGCRYCMECPAGVDIPKVFAVFNEYRINKKEEEFLRKYDELGEAKQAHHCVGCKKCMEHCPQAIQIPVRMKEIGEVYQTVKAGI